MTLFIENEWLIQVANMRMSLLGLLAMIEFSLIIFIFLFHTCSKSDELQNATRQVLIIVER